MRADIGAFYAAREILRPMMHLYISYRNAAIGSSCAARRAG
jgi:hypothetical protein